MFFLFWRGSEFGENRGFLGFMALGANFCAPEPGRVAKAGETKTWKCNLEPVAYQGV